MRTNLPCALLVILILSACVSPPPPASQAAATTTEPDAMVPGETVRPDPEDPYAAPPRLKVGDWWQVSVTSAYFDSSVSARIIVADTTADAYILGVRPEDPLDELLEIHIPPIGPVQRSSLGFDSHETRFDPLRFPLKEGATWTSLWWGTDVTVEAISVTPTEARLRVSNEWEPEYATFTYSPQVGFLTNFEIPGYASYEVTEWGTNHTGPVVAVDAYRVLFETGRWRGVFWGPVPEPPLLRAVVPAEFNHLSVGLVAEAVTPGLYEVRLRKPDGSQHTFQVLPTDGAGRHGEFLGSWAPAGEWQIVFVAAGDGSVMVEGIGAKLRWVAVCDGKTVEGLTLKPHCE